MFLLRSKRKEQRQLPHRLPCRYRSQIDASLHRRDPFPSSFRGCCCCSGSVPLLSLSFLSRSCRNISLAQGEADRRGTKLFVETLQAPPGSNLWPFAYGAPSLGAAAAGTEVAWRVITLDLPPSAGAARASSSFRSHLQLLSAPFASSQEDFSALPPLTSVSCSNVFFGRRVKRGFTLLPSSSLLLFVFYNMFISVRLKSSRWGSSPSSTHWSFKDEDDNNTLCIYSPFKNRIHKVLTDKTLHLIS